MLDVTICVLYSDINCVQLTSSAVELQESELIPASFVLESLADYLYRQDSANITRPVLEQQAGYELHNSHDCIKIKDKTYLCAQ